MKRNELRYNKGIDESRLILMVIEPREHIDEDHVFSFILSLFQNIIDHEKNVDETTNNSLKNYIFERSLFDKLIQNLIEREQDKVFDPYQLSFDLVSSTVRFGTHYYNTTQDELKNYILNLIPHLNEDEAAAFIQDDLLTEESLANKAAFWDRHEN